MADKRSARLLLRLRVVDRDVILLGPGKVDLLEAIDRHHTVRDAAAELGMSYMRAWGLVQVMNEGFKEPLVILHRGGSAHGGAELSETGREAVRLYRALEAEASDSTKRTWRTLQKLLR